MTYGASHIVYGLLGRPNGDCCPCILFSGPAAPFLTFPIGRRRASACSMGRRRSSACSIEPRRGLTPQQSRAPSRSSPPTARPPAPNPSPSPKTGGRARVLAALHRRFANPSPTPTDPTSPWRSPPPMEAAVPDLARAGRALAVLTPVAAAVLEGTPARVTPGPGRILLDLFGGSPGWRCTSGSDPNMRRFHTPVAYPIRPVKLSPLQIKRAEILQVKQQLDDLLKEARINLKTPAQYEPNISVTVQQPWTGVILKSGIAVAVFLASMKRLTAFQTFWKVGSNAVDIAMKYESENDLYARVVHEFSSKMKATIEYALENKEISAELAKELLNVVDKYDTTVSMILARNGSRFFSLNVLKAVLQLPQNVASLADKLRAYGSAFRFLNSFADAAYRVSQSVGDPGLFEDIGKEAIDITRDDFLLNKVQLDVMQKHSLTFGAEIVGENLIKKMMLNLRNSDLSMCLSASEVVPGQAAEPNGADVNLCNPNFAEFHVEKLFADNIKGKLHLSYPLRNSKFELQSLQEFQSISGCIGLNRKRKPSFSLSSFWGVKDL